MVSIEQAVARRARNVAERDVVLREAACRHMDGRRQRLEEYAASLELALATELARHPLSAHGARLESQLKLARAAVARATRQRVPQAGAAGAVPVALRAQR
ncbi:MAG TPA: hypothetical protein VFN74_05025 [Chloroflexota bacterium]|nr:hypothetical protein [Chloroflexota bacterium]